MVPEFNLKKLSILWNSLPYFNLSFDKNHKIINIFTSAFFVNKLNNKFCNQFSNLYSMLNHIFVLIQFISLIQFTRSLATQRSFYSLKIFYGKYIVFTFAGNMCFNGHIIFIKINYKFLLKKFFQNKLILLF